MSLYSSTRLSQSDPMNNHYTIEELIAELTRVAAERGWGPQLPTNISEILPDSQHVRLLHGNEKDIEELKDQNARMEREIASLERELCELGSK